MTLEDFFRAQAEFDKQHGWDVSAIPQDERLLALERDFIGLFGEIGEAANLLKKARLNVKSCMSPARAYENIKSDLHEELLDVFIYLIRLFQITEIDVEYEYLLKMKTNKERFRKFERQTN